MSEFFILFTFYLNFFLLRAELWEKNVSSDMKIGLSTTGYKSVDLRCDAEHFTVNVTLDNDFAGVVYVKGNYYDKKLPCFKHHHQTLFRGDENIVIEMKVPFNRCRTVMDVAESCYTNTLVIQHDPELIMPGDAAFSLECAFEPEFKVTSEMSTESVFKSKITLVSADPGDKNNHKKNSKFTVSSDTEKVTFLPKSAGHLGKDEL